MNIVVLFVTCKNIHLHAVNFRSNNETIIRVERSKLVSEIIVPTKYLGNEISVKYSRYLLQSKVGRRKQVDGLVYMKKMMPSGKEKNGWDIVLRRPMKETLKDGCKGKSYNIITPEGSIIVHFSTVKVSK